MAIMQPLGTPFLQHLGRALLLTLLAGCSSPKAVPDPAAALEPAWWEDVTEQAGLAFRHDAGPPGRYFMPQIMGSGAALFDADGDGRLDIYLLQNGGPDSPSVNRLYLQGAGGKFRDASAGSGLDVTGHGMGVAAGDVNNDGRPDVLVTQFGGARLFLNQGGGTFREATRESGMVDLHWGTSCCFVDYDRDGWLDLVVVNYVDYDPAQGCSDAGGKPDYCHPRTFPGTVTRLYRNKGSRTGSQGAWAGFADRTLDSGLGRLPGPGLGVLAADFDGDGWPDLFVANDAHANHLWVNRRDGTFTEEAVPRGLAYNGLGQPQANMGVAQGDVDGDGHWDLFVTHLTEEHHTLWKQGPRGLFRDDTAGAALTRARWRGTGFGTALADFDLDGAPDLALVNGRVSRNPRVPRGDDFWAGYAERNQLFANDGKGLFRDISWSNPALCGTPGVARGLALGDLDGDGAPDLLVTRVAGPARLLRNVAPRRGHGVTVRALDPTLRRDAYGAAVTARSGDARKTAWVNPGSSYLCSHAPHAYLGLGPLDHVDTFEVLWPDGTEEVFPGGPAGRLVTLRKGEGRPAGHQGTRNTPTP